jgi:hypothetical protein
MPRRQYRHSRAAIHDREGQNWDAEPLYSAPLSPDQIRQKRVELCEEMLTLLLGDDGIESRPRQTLQRIYTSLGSIRGQL